MRWPRPARLAVVLVACALIPGVVAALYDYLPVGLQADESILLPSGQRITPAGVQVEVNDRPMGVTVSPDGGQAAVITGSNFEARVLHLLDLGSGTVVQTLTLGGAFVGVVYSPDGRSLYVGGGSDNDVKIFSQGPDGTWELTNQVTFTGGEPSGLSVSPRGDRLYVALNRATGMAIVDTAALTYTTVATGSYPFTTVATAGGDKVYISNWGGRMATGDDPAAVQMLPLTAQQGPATVIVDPETGIANSGTVSVYDTAVGAVTKSIEVGLHPSGMVLSPDGAKLYVVNANSDSISVIDTQSDSVVRTISVKSSPDALLGSSPNAIAISADGRTLYVANGGNNAIAVVEPGRDGEAALRGFIPVGWFPMAVAVGGGNLIVCNGYGFGSIAPARPLERGRSFLDRKGVVSLIPLPGSGQLRDYTKRVQRNNTARKGREMMNGVSPVPVTFGGSSPIQHVIYVIKENRTYDQLFGDVRAGNGDPTLAIFGGAVTPNQHALVSQFELFDNLYAAGDASSLGHQWCDESYPTDYTHRFGNARNDFNGTNPMTFAPTGFLWTNALRHGKTVKIYGEFANQTQIRPAGAVWADFYTAWKNGVAGPKITAGSAVKSVQPLLAANYPGMDLRITEQLRADLFLADFAQFELSGMLPNLIVLQLPYDHTVGTAVGYPTPAAMVADNDLAVGRIVDAVSHSRYWASTAIFITEDDTQDGVDHVDGHRNPGFIVSPYTRRGGYVDSSFYTSANFFRTIEQILGLPPLNQYDANAEPMYSAFVNVPDLTPFRSVPNQVPLDQMNPPVAGLTGMRREHALASMRMDFSEADEAPVELLNRVIWHSVKGYRAPYPVVREGAVRLCGR